MYKLSFIHLTLQAGYQGTSSLLHLLVSFAFLHIVYFCNVGYGILTALCSVLSCVCTDSPVQIESLKALAV